MHQDTDTKWRCALNIKLSSTDQRDISETNVTGRRGREHRMNVVGGREQDTDDVVMVHTVALEHLLEKFNCSRPNLIGGVAFNCCCATKRPMSLG